MQNLKMINQTFLLGLFILSLNSCTESIKKTSKFIYEIEESSVQLKILNGNDYLTYNTPIRVDFEWKNIEPETVSIYGAGIKLLRIKNEVTQTEINIERHHLISDTLDIKLSFELNGQKTSTYFNIPVKN
ncbi:MULTISPECIES: hypothetical protein [Leeuwenhoekiella]|jgi:hypothetical protein|uniref:Uncharacterized protein n=2 Tax=Leeuwenhoekiella TaxID=283735 RepID=A3XLE8_LEEBM|nr:hypothetical protein [Leeuwenhoekiella sp.]EAQ49628.1 hypothetical protein MED217_12254 [Leeuwenhoekiella blandensis MED217]MAO42219.1 hypothetical protein [Leeuwenhoekiella sp.]MBQ51376.1 hypothetical protein [Leeuwenhoekiella sp.]HCW63719.1 hypothetical protein [Leeuwenhoekiella sp.]|tara:strand:+ start:2335 stop:2724 length:390 start_codon:yes stop_codon:yes gene_type:complete